MKLLEDIIGKNYKVYQLKSLRHRLAQKIQRSDMPKQSVRLIVTQGGQKYKLISFSSDNISRWQYIRTIKPFLDVLDFVPQIIYFGDTDILMKYVEGLSPQVDDNKFSSLLGRNMSQIHKLNVEYISKENIQRDIKQWLDYLVGKGALTVGFAEMIFKKLLLNSPPKIRMSMVYEDQNAQNFIIDLDGEKLYFPDLDSFSYGITGFFLYRDSVIDKISKKHFWESYFGEGGDEYLLKNDFFISHMADIFVAANSLRLFYELPIYELRRKIRRLRQSKARIKRLTREILN